MTFVLTYFFAFIGGFFSKHMEIRASYNDMYFFLRKSWSLYLYTLFYGVVGIAFYWILQNTGVFSKEIVNPEITGKSDTSFALIITAFISGLSSKALLDLPLGNQRDNPINLSSFLNFIFPDIDEVFKNEIARNQNTFLNKIIANLKNGEELSHKELNEKVYNFLRLHDNYKDENGQRNVQLIMTTLVDFEKNGENKPNVLRYLYINLGRRIFSSLFENTDQ